MSSVTARHGNDKILRAMDNGNHEIRIVFVIPGWPVAEVPIGAVLEIPNRHAGIVVQVILDVFAAEAIGGDLLGVFRAKGLFEAF